MAQYWDDDVEAFVVAHGGKYAKKVLDGMAERDARSMADLRAFELVDFLRMYCVGRQTAEAVYYALHPRLRPGPSRQRLASEAVTKILYAATFPYGDPLHRAALEEAIEAARVARNPGVTAPIGR